jgi:hypothetical protein
MRAQKHVHTYTQTLRERGRAKEGAVHVFSKLIDGKSVRGFSSQKGLQRIGSYLLTKGPATLSLVIAPQVTGKQRNCRRVLHSTSMPS